MRLDDIRRLENHKKNTWKKIKVSEYGDPEFNKQSIVAS
jgi:hypothetical protein